MSGDCFLPAATFAAPGKDSDDNNNSNSSVWESRKEPWHQGALHSYVKVHTSHLNALEDTDNKYLPG